MRSGRTGRLARRDARATRTVLLEVAGRLVAEHGTSFGLSDLARAAGVSTATVYRHFADMSGLLSEYQAGLVDDLATALRGVPRDLEPLDRLREMSVRWVDRIDEWGRAAARLRSEHGVLERVRMGDPSMTELHGTLAPVVHELIQDGEIRAQPVDLGVLLWLAIFDERLVLELRHQLGLSKPATARRLTEALLGALGRTAGN